MATRPKLTPEQRLANAKAKRAAAEREVRRLLSDQQKQARATDARRKIISGALCETHALKNPASEFATVYVRLLKTVEPRDRHLFAEVYRALLPADEAEKLLGDAPLQAAPESNLDAAE